MRTLKESTRMMIYSCVFCVLALLFFLLFQLDVISNLDFYSVMVYITYFAGLALYYNSKILKENNKSTSSKVCFWFAMALILVSIVALIYGFATGNILFWVW